MGHHISAEETFVSQQWRMSMHVSYQYLKAGRQGGLHLTSSHLLHLAIGPFTLSGLTASLFWGQTACKLSRLSPERDGTLQPLP